MQDKRGESREDLADLILLRIQTVTELTGLSRSRIYELIAAGDLPSIKIGSSRRVVATELRDWIARKRQ